jgi:hypothetical protein
MRRMMIIVITGALLLLSAVSTFAQNNYSGTWVLEKGSQKIVPKNMVNYTVVIKQDGDKLTVMTSPGGTDNTGGQGSGDLNNASNMTLQHESSAQSQGAKSATGVLVRSSGTMGEAAPGSNVPGSMALQMVFAQANYTLDGKKATAYVEGLGNAQFLGKWSKGGKSLELTITHDETRNGQTQMAFSSKEQWTLSADGQTLKLHRAVSTQAGSDNVVLVFRKKPTP